MSLLTFTPLSISSCGFTKNSYDNLLAIKDISTTMDANGNVIVTITYNDSTLDPKVFIIPGGTDGKDGVSIDRSEVDYDSVEEGGCRITIYYTDPNINPTEITLYNGKDGKDGRGIEMIASSKDDEGNLILTIKFTDGSSKDFQIPKGDQGNKGEDGQDGTMWYNDAGSPTNSSKVSEAKTGDYYFDTFNLVIYVKEEDGSWKEVTSLTDSKEYTVTFYANKPEDVDKVAVSKGDGNVIFESSLQITVKEGTCLYNQMPSAGCESYTFQGWYTSKTPGPTSGMFTDLTPVTCNLELYAKWSKIVTTE